MKVEIDVPDIVVKNCVVSGVEGGINYWAGVLLYKWQNLAQVQLTVTDMEADGQAYDVTDWAEAVKVMATKYPKHFGDLLANNGDCVTGDVLVQCAVFGELKYG